MHLPSPSGSSCTAHTLCTSVPPSRRLQTCHFRKRATSATGEGTAYGLDFERHCEVSLRAPRAQKWHVYGVLAIILLLIIMIMTIFIIMIMIMIIIIRFIMLALLLILILLLILMLLL